VLRRTRAAGRRVGCSRRAVPLFPTDYRLRDGATSRRKSRPFIEDLVRRRNAGEAIRTFEAIGLHTDGHTFPIEITLSPVRLADGPANLAFVLDRTERVRAEAERLARGDETLLVVEDDPAVRRSLEQALLRMGYRVLLAPHGLAALELLQQHPEIDLLVSDLVLPGMSGWALAERVRTEHPDLTTLFMSGYTDNRVVQQAIQDGDCPFIHKPFTPSALGAKIRELLDAV
jgi:CheY-like chemotaxis protein